jgi:hypothetical protein
MSTIDRRKARRVLLNSLLIGTAKDWHEAEQCMWEFSEMLFEHVGAGSTELRNMTEMRCVKLHS